jgi:hypothetical protein
MKGDKLWEYKDVSVLPYLSRITVFTWRHLPLTRSWW